MADKTILDYELDSGIVDDDYLLYWKTASGVVRRAARSSVAGANLADTTAENTFTEEQTFSSAIAADAGINFGGTTLATYAEGSWTPTLTFGGGNTGMTLEAVGRYTRIGNLVQAWGRIRVTAKGSSTGNASIGNLPYTSSDVTSPNVLYYPVSIYVENVAFTGYMEGAVANNATSFLLVQNADGTITVLTDTAFSTNDSVYFSVNYRTGT